MKTDRVERNAQHTYERIYSRYDPDHDIGANAPIHWSVYELAELVLDLTKTVAAQARQIDALLEAVPSTKRTD
jgi:hypothetical protein